MTSEGTDQTGGELIERGTPAALVPDESDEKLSAFDALRKSDRAAADQILEQVGASNEVDRDIILELAAKRPLGNPGRYLEAHSGAIRALEVLDHNGRRGISAGRLGPLAPIGQYVIQPCPNDPDRR